MLPQLPSMRALLLLAVLAYYAPTSRAGSEHLLFHELNDDIVAVTAAYTAHRTGSGHDTTFPRSISSLLDSFPIQELNLTLTRGRWREEWGAGVGPTAPPGATLSVEWHPSIRFENVHTMWSGVTNALSGLLCTSLSTLARAQMYTTHSVATPGSKPALQTYGVLSQEAVCTENLAGLAQMLPCGAKFGTAKLLDPSVMFSSPFHSMNLQACAFDGPPAGRASVNIHATYAQQDPQHTVVSAALQSPQSLHACPATSAATVALVSQSVNNHTSFTTALTQHSWRCSGNIAVASGLNLDRTGASSSVGGTTVTVCRDDRAALVATSTPPQGSKLRNLSGSGLDGPAANSNSGASKEESSADAHLKQQQTPRAPPLVPVLASQELRGAGEESHLFVLELKPSPAYWRAPLEENSVSQTASQSSFKSSGECSAGRECAADWEHVDKLKIDGVDEGLGMMRGRNSSFSSSREQFSVCTHSMLPWFVQPWFHTLQVHVDGQVRPLHEVLHPGYTTSCEQKCCIYVENVFVVAQEVRLEPGERRRRMHVLHLCFNLSPVPRAVVVTVDVTTPLLYIDEYPADASRGFDVPATRVTVPSAAALPPTHPQAQCMEHVSNAYAQLDAVSHESGAKWLAGLACQDMHVLHTTASIVTVAQPDFSMPYIVCALSSSVLAIFSGVFFTRLVERPQQTALRQLKSGNSLTSKLRPLLIMGACIILVPYMDPEWRDWVASQLEKVGVDPTVLGLA